MDLKGSRILVTGAGGLIGSHIVDLLIPENPKEIVAFDKDLSSYREDLSPALDYSPVKFFTGDITRKDEVNEALKGIDFVIHTAALLTRETAKDLRAALDVNICGTFNIIEGSVASRIKKFVFSSSTSVYGDPSFTPLTEEHPFNANSMYGACKVTGELFLRVVQKANGLDYTALRYTSVYGPRQHYRANLVLYVPESFDRIEKGLPPVIYGDGSHLYDYIFVEDVARANILALKSQSTGDVFTIGTGVATTVKEVVQMIIEITGTSLDPVYEPQGDRFGIKSLILDVSKAERVLGFKAQVPLRQGLQEYYKWRKKKKQTA